MKSKISIAIFLMVLTVAFGSHVFADDIQENPGLLWVFYNDSKLTQPGISDIDPLIDVDTGDRFSDYGKIWRGRIHAPFAGTVVFQVEADNGLRLFIDDRIVIDGWAMDGAREGTVTFPEKGGSHSFRLEYFQEGGVGFIRPFWKWQGQSKQLIPASAFSHAQVDLDFAEEELKSVKGVERTPLSYEFARTFREGEPTPVDGPIQLKKGPYPLLDDFLIAESRNIRRIVNQPQRNAEIPNPVVTGKEDGCFQPYLTVLKNPGSGEFRIWYGCRTENLDTSQSRIGFMESKDGIHWERPHRVLEDPGPIQFGVAVIDDGSRSPDPNKRYKFAWYKGDGLKIAVSPDGFQWTPIQKDPFILHNHDITGLWYDPVHSRYLATLSVYRPGDPWQGNRRLTMHAHSDDLTHWSEPRYVLLPDSEVDSGETQFYAMDGYLARGDLLIGMVKVLRDDLKVDDPPDPPEAYGVGYTTLAWTRDGETWYRDTEHFFDPSPTKGEWDHAHAWIDEQLPVGDEVFLYYGGYKSGHKVNRFEERQIGLVKIKRDRYVAREASGTEGFLRTPTVTVEGDQLTLNVDADEGKALVQVNDPEGNPVPGFAFSNCAPITTDSLAAPVRWERDIADLAGQKISFEISLANARLFALGVE